MKFSEYSEILIRQLMPVYGKEITYKRRDQVIAEFIPAIPSKSALPINATKADTRMKSVNRNYIVKLELLEGIEPKAGDRIIDGNVEYEVVNNDNKQCFRPIDTDNDYIRIFVQKIKTN